MKNINQEMCSIFCSARCDLSEDDLLRITKINKFFKGMENEKYKLTLSQTLSTIVSWGICALEKDIQKGKENKVEGYDKWEN